MLFSFGSLMNIDKLIREGSEILWLCSFGSLMNIDKLIPARSVEESSTVLVL